MRRAGAILGALLALAWPGAALAHGGYADPWSTWSLDPLTLAGMGLLGLGYGAGLRRLWRRAGVGRGISRARAAAFAGGWLALAAALVAPLDAAAAVWFSAHMAQHVTLMLVAAPLLVIGDVPLALLWAVKGARAPERLARAVSGALAAALRARLLLPLGWAALVITLWLWHLPALYEAALYHEAVHAIEHLSLLGAGLLFWWAALRPRHEGLGYGASVLAVFTLAIQGGLLSALLVFAPAAWYPAYGGRAVMAGLLYPDGPNSLYCVTVAPATIQAALLADQQLAGAIMWVPAGLIHLAALAWLVLAWLRSVERASRPLTKGESA